jgi:hypothetical protein
MVEANGRKISLPKSRKRTSPGMRPMPNFSNQGKADENTNNTRKIIISQRNMHLSF